MFGLQAHDELQLVRRQALHVGGVVAAGEGVLALHAGGLEGAVEDALGVVHGGLEHHVLEEVGEAREALLLVDGSHVEPGVEAEGGGGVVLEHQDLQAVGQLVALDLALAEEGLVTPVNRAH
jgi:hypothetical protein